MSEALAAGEAGRGVRIAVADTGLETCHPDLAANIEPGASYNFNLSDWSGTLVGDPFNHSALGDHGTSVAGTAAAVHRNGLGGRGVAAEAMLRGYNLLEAIDWPRAWMDSLGASPMSPNSSEVDIFNMELRRPGIRGAIPTPISKSHCFATASPTCAAAWGRSMSNRQATGSVAAGRFRAASTT